MPAIGRPGAPSVTGANCRGGKEEFRRGQRAPHADSQLGVYARQRPAAVALAAVPAPADDGRGAGGLPVANTLPPTIDELTEGRGDLLTADLRDRLPFAMHQTNPINHAEALWHPTIQAQVLNILGVKVPVPPAGGVTSFWW